MAEVAQGRHHVKVVTNVLSHSGYKRQRVEVEEGRRGWIRGILKNILKSTPGEGKLTYISVKKSPLEQKCHSFP